MGTVSRPTSPHIGIYRWQITMTMSILHRVTGVALSLGTLALVYWLLATAMGPVSYANAHWFFSTWIGQLLMWGWTFSLFYHLCNGIRHLFWDVGKGFEIKDMYTSGYAVWVVALVMTVIAIAVAYMKGGAA